LANSSTFQRFAQATHEKINQIPVKPKRKCICKCIYLKINNWNHTAQPTRASYNPYRISEYPTEPVDGRIGETLANFTNALKSNIQKEISKQVNSKINKFK
jgi:hypothetical protein